MNKTQRQEIIDQIAKYRAEIVQINKVIEMLIAKKDANVARRSLVRDKIEQLKETIE